jgi:hypothetical protein
MFFHFHALLCLPVMLLPACFLLQRHIAFALLLWYGKAWPLWHYASDHFNKYRPNIE